MTGKALHQQLLDGFEVKSRKDGWCTPSSTTAKRVAEVCVGTKKVRLNVRA